MTPDERLARELAVRIPWFEEMLEDHIDFEHEVSPHVLFWDVTQETVKSFIERDAEVKSDLPDWREVLQYLEEQIKLDIREVNVVIATSFLNYLPYPGQPGREIVEHLPPALAEEFAEIRPNG